MPYFWIHTSYPRKDAKIKYNHTIFKSTGDLLYLFISANINVNFFLFR